jgi:hypothetical protein
MEERRAAHVYQNFVDKMSSSHSECQFMGGMEISEMCGQPKTLSRGRIEVTPTDTALVNRPA